MYSLATHDLGKNAVISALSEHETLVILLPLLQSGEELDIKTALPIYSGEFFILLEDSIQKKVHIT